MKKNTNFLYFITFELIVIEITQMSHKVSIYLPTTDIYIYIYIYIDLLVTRTRTHVYLSVFILINIHLDMVGLPWVSWPAPGSSQSSGQQRDGMATAWGVWCYKAYLWLETRSLGCWVALGLALGPGFMCIWPCFRCVGVRGAPSWAYSGGLQQNLLLCRQVDVSSDCLLRVVLGFAVAITIFSVRHRSHLREPHL